MAELLLSLIQDQALCEYFILYIALILNNIIDFNVFGDSVDSCCFTFFTSYLEQPSLHSVTVSGITNAQPTLHKDLIISANLRACCYFYSTQLLYLKYKKIKNSDTASE